MAIPFSNQDPLDKLLTFIKASKDESMESMFNKWKSEGGYSDRTKVVVLTVDMSNMGAGKVRREFKECCIELELLKRKEPTIIPFLHCDFRNPDMDNLFDLFVGRHNWGGVKMYNSMGTFPQSLGYDYIYHRLVELNKPVIAHTTYGNAVHFKGSEKQLAHLLGNVYNPKASRKENCDKFTNPLNWEKVSQRHPDLRIWLAHFGGSDAWKEWSKNPHDKSNLVNVILGVMERCLNIYTDISFTLNDKRLYPVLYKLMTRDEYSFIRERVLYGSDWYMNKTECTERQWADDLEYSVGKDIFNQIARINTHKFLYNDLG
jgi:predicted TIM-barrel fold metal-dependent hydrolase